MKEKSNALGDPNLVSDSAMFPLEALTSVHCTPAHTDCPG